MTIVSKIFVGHRIQVASEIYTVSGSLKMRSGYKYVCTTASGKKISIDRLDLIEAQKDGSAKILAA